MTNMINTDMKECGAAVSVEDLMAQIQKLTEEEKRELLVFINGIS